MQLRGALADAIALAAREAVNEPFCTGYVEYPDTVSEMAETHILAAAAIGEEPSKLEDWL